MPKEVVYKTIRQYNSVPVSKDELKKLMEIAGDYARVKNETYQRYSGIHSLKKLYPGYTIQKELAGSGLREQLELPSVYFNLAVYDAVADIKGQWTRTKNKVLERIGHNENLTEADKHYLRFLLKVSNCFIAVLNREEPELPADIQRQRAALQAKVDADRLNNYLRRQVRKCHVKLKTEQEDVFSLTERAYRYGDHGIYISIKEKRKRIFIPLTDNNQYQCQLSVKLFPEEQRLELYVPVQVKVHKNADFVNRIGLAAGMYTMFTTNEGHCYGERFGEYQLPYAAWLREQNQSYSRNKEANPGRKKYYAKKHRLEEQLHSYINQELNRFFREEQPEVIYLVKLPKTQKRPGSSAINYSVSLWQRGYIRTRLEQKCKEQSVKLVEVLGKDIAKECSCCGAVVDESAIKKEGSVPEKTEDFTTKQAGDVLSEEQDVKTGTGWKKNAGKWFQCPFCGFEIEEKTNTARNVLGRGLSGKIVN